MIKVMYTDRTVEQFRNANKWIVGPDFVKLIDKDNKEVVIIRNYEIRRLYK